ncbi:MAG TPA: ZIP family metal transporter [Rhizomicrobium sp.]|jgi:ZIP family zinc transporter
MSTLLILAVALGTGCATFAGGALALRLADRLHLLLGFSAGAVIAVAFFDLLPESIRLGAGTCDPATILSISALGFFAYASLDRLIFLHGHDSDNAHPGATTFPAKGWAGAGSLSVHSFMDGLAIGVAFHASSRAGIVVAAAVLAHDCSDGMNTVNLVLKSGGSVRDAFRWLIADAVAPVLGVIVSLFLVLPATVSALALSLFAGFFLYIGASDLLPESRHAHPKFLSTITTLAGALFLYLVIRLAG